jgi:DNA-binding CsgD family transcriptional regulator
LRTFEAVGAPRWAARAEEELARLSLPSTDGTGLTPSERRVAEKAAAGLSNRDIAAALFLAPKTVEMNLSRAYRKLGIRSRAQLSARLAAADSEANRS